MGEGPRPERDHPTVPSARSPQVSLAACPTTPEPRISMLYFSLQQPQDGITNVYNLKKIESPIHRTKSRQNPKPTTFGIHRMQLRFLVFTK